MFMWVCPGSPGDDRQSVAVKDLLDAIYPRSDKPDYVVRLEPIQTSTKAVFQYITTEEELARYPSRTPRWEIPPPHMTVSSSYLGVTGATVEAQIILLKLFQDSLQDLLEFLEIFSN